MAESFDTRQGIFSDELTTICELLCATFLKIIAENDRQRFNYLMASLQEIAAKSYETFIETNVATGEVVH